MAAERQNEKHKRAPNCRQLRFVCKTKDACTLTDKGIFHFHAVKDYDSFIEAFLPRLLVDDQVRAAPDGIYCWILREKKGELHTYAMKVICKQEIGSLHNFIYILSSDLGPLLGEGDKFKDAKEVIAAGELKVSGGQRVFNLQSGSFMEPIFGITSCQPIPGRRIHKTRAMLIEERDNKAKERDRLTGQVAPRLSATFASVDLPEPDNPLEKTAVTDYAKSVSQALGGTPFIQGAEIMTSENNIGLIQSLMSADVPECQGPLHVSTFKNAKQSYAKHATHATQAKKPYAKKGGARRTRKARRSHKSHRARRV
jgi:hypothetical protein